MIKISFLCNWGESSSDLLKKYAKQTPKNSGIWGKLVGTTNTDDADYIIVLGNNININFLPKNKNILQFRREPDLIEKFNPIGDLFFDYENGYHVSTWQFLSKSFEELKDFNLEKSKLVSGITSDKWEHRNIFFEKINNLNFGIDIYGKNFSKLDSLFKDEGLEKYKYSIAIENSSQKNYFTEKINDCFLLSTMPIYWGCPNILKFFPQDSFRTIDINNPESIKDILSEPLCRRNIDAIMEAKNLVMYKYNLWPTIENLI